MTSTTARTMSSYARRAGAGLLAIGLATGLSACTGAEAAPQAPATSTAPATAEDKQDLDMASVFQKAFEAKTTAHITVSGSEGAEKGAGTVDIDNTGSRKAHLSMGDGKKNVDAVIDADNVYAKLPGQAKYVAVPMSLLGMYAQGQGLDITDLGGLSGMVGKGSYQRTEDVEGESLKVYTVMLDLSKLPLDKAGATGRSAVPVNVWLDSQERPRRLQVKDLAVPGKDGKATVKKVNFAVNITWGGPVTVTVPASSQVTAFTPEMLQGLLGKGSKSEGSAKSV